MRMVWTYDPRTQSYSSQLRNVENYITHNGDLDFYTIHSITYPLSEIQTILARMLHAPVPATVDSACVAGLLDLLRTAGIWHASVSYGYLFGALASAGSITSVLDSIWSAEVLDKVACVFEDAWKAIMAEITHAKSKDSPNSTMSQLRAAMESRMQSQVDVLCEVGALSIDGVAALIECSVRAFLEQDLLAASRQLLKHAVGSFGLVLSSSLDAKREVVLGARGQTMSVAFYPNLGCFLFGSESASTKAGLGLGPSAPAVQGGSGASRKRSRAVFPSEGEADASTYAVAPGFEDGFRFDLDDVNGEVLLLRWGADDEYMPAIKDEKRPMMQVMRFDEGTKALWAANFLEERHGYVSPFMSRCLRLGSNPLVSSLPDIRVADPVGRDIADIPRVLERIVEDWNEPGESLNRLTAYTLMQRLRKKMLAKEQGKDTGAVDLLIAGCEVSLWVGEQFASDLHNAFPGLRIVTLSSNKLLGQLGQAFPAPQVGFSFNEHSYDFSDTVCLLISHSGGTFGTLNVANLLKGYTDDIFTVTSEWDTQLGRAVRGGKPGAKKSTNSWSMASYVFTTFCGVRPAEPCSLTVAATHQLLTQILLYLMYAMRAYEPERPSICGSRFAKEEVQELESLNINTVNNLKLLCGTDGAAPHPARSSLLAQGRRWADHVLEGPRSWLLSLLYILLTVVSGYTPLSLIAFAIRYGAVGSWGWHPPVTNLIQYPIAVLDAFIYAFLPWWTTVILRLIGRRTWHHRVAGRSLLIGDIPWVSQSLEAFVSKLFALSYSIASLNVSSGNPLDHLVHRHTHRVVRGGLLAVGRPDGRLDALSSAENTVCLSVNQASSIQNMGVRLESVTVGHNSFKLPLSAQALYLPDTRPRFVSEHALTSKVGQCSSAAATMGALTGLRDTSSIEMSSRDSSEHGHGRLPDNAFTSTKIAKQTVEDGACVPNVQRPAHFRKIDIDSVRRQAFLGEWMSKDEKLHNATIGEWMDAQNELQELYEGRMGSLERFVAFLVLFHAMGKQVQDWWPRVSCGMLGYDMSRSHSIMRIATTASPVPGYDVRQKIIEIAEATCQATAARVIAVSFRLQMKLRKDKADSAITASQTQIDRMKREMSRGQGASHDEDPSV